MSMLGLMVRDAPQAALLTMRVQDFAAERALILEEPAEGGRLEEMDRCREDFVKQDSIAIDRQRDHHV